MKLPSPASKVENKATPNSNEEPTAPPERQKHCTAPPSPPRKTIPLGTGSVDRSGSAVLEFVPSPEKAEEYKKMTAKMSMAAAGANPEIEVPYKRASSSFLRVADLQMDETVSLRSASEDSEESYPNFHHIAVDPPPGVALDEKERWVVLDDGDGNHSPIGPLAVDALSRSGLARAFEKEMWTADGKTAKILKQAPEWNAVVWQKGGAAKVPSTQNNAFNEKDILVWSGTFKHGHYGSELPAIRSVGLIHSSPRALLDLLVDSSRVKEYNKLCLGRTDLLILQESMDKAGAFGGVTKVMKTESKPPVVRKTLRFTSLLHARELEDGSGYKMVTRAVTLPEEKEDLANALKSEILLGATIIKRVEGNDNRCLLVSINHLRSPMVPMMIAKRIGLQAAVGFIQDLRSCCNDK